MMFLSFARNMEDETDVLVVVVAVIAAVIKKKSERNVRRERHG